MDKCLGKECKLSLVIVGIFAAEKLKNKRYESKKLFGSSFMRGFVHLLQAEWYAADAGGELSSAHFEAGRQTVVCEIFGGNRR